MNPFSNAPNPEASRRISDEYALAATQESPIMDPATRRKLRDAALFLAAVVCFVLGMVNANRAITDLRPGGFTTGYFLEALLFHGVALVAIVLLWRLRSTDEPLD